jgi:glycolate oxidase iron-sulfur subunit
MSFDPDRLNQCVACGLCLSSCPTFDITRLEQHGPRGRIEGMRLVQNGTFDILDPDYVASMETCVQCRACEDICPSDVEFGALMEQARGDITRAQRQRGRRPDVRRLVRSLLLALIIRPRLFRLLTAGLAVLQRTRLDRLLPVPLRVARKVRSAGPATAQPATGATATAHLFRGCVMDQWFADVHTATEQVLGAAGHTVDGTARSVCCGALHLHAGEEDRALALALETVESYAGSTGPVVVNSAGCAAMMKEYGRLLATPAAHAFAQRVRDLSEVVDATALPLRDGPPRRLAWQAPCHLRYVQKADASSRAALEAVPGVEVVEADDQQLCCGAGGAYSVMEPELSSALGAQKCDALRATGCDAVVSSNPGCMLQLAAGGMDVVHIAEVIAAALDEGKRP